MPTMAERYGAQNRCAPAEVPQRIFWQTLHRHAVPIAPLLLRSSYFESDRSLIDACVRATSLQQVHDEIHIHPVRAHHGSWLHRHARLRVSRQRLHRLAARCFAESVSAH